MKLSTNWLKEYLKLPITNLNDANKFAEQIGLTSAEVESVDFLVPASTNLIVVEVKSVDKISDSDHLKKVVVFDGEKEYQVVTGAGNVEKGQLVIFAKPGAVLFDGKKIDKTRMANIESNGMLVSLQEIGFSDSIAPKKHEEGIYVFPEISSDEITIGQNASIALGVDDIIIETSLTANRADMLSIKGNVFEFGAMLDTPVKEITADVVENVKEAKNLISVEVDSELSDNYNLRVIENVQVSESPLWLQKHLWTSGIRPINNVVDVTNYTMLLFGQPLHAFDLDSLTSKKIKVALSNDENLVTLDGVERKLKTGEDVVVYDDKKPLMLAGVMGGIDSEVTSKTKNIVLESAIFNAQNIRKTAQRFSLHSEASSRFERGINYDDVIPALNFAANLITEIAGGDVLSGIVSQTTKKTNNHEISISLNQINNYLGTELKITEIKDVLKRLHFKFEEENGDFSIDAPARRWDIAIPADIIEEIIRIYGYQHIVPRLPQAIDKSAGLNKKQKIIRQINQILRGLSLSQAMTYSLKSKLNASNFSILKEPQIELDYPMSEDRSVLRQSVLTSLFDAAQYNSARSQKEIALFEIGDVFGYRNSPDEFFEQTNVAGIVIKQNELNWKNNKNTEFDFYDIKGIVEALFKQLDIPVRFSVAENINNMHPGRTAEIVSNNQIIGFVGQIHPEITKNEKMPETFAFEINLDAVVSLFEAEIRYEPISKFPEITRDLTLVIPKEISQNQIFDSIDELKIAELNSVNLFDIYNDDSYTYRLTFANDNNQLSSEDVDKLVMDIQNKLVNSLKVEVK